ncbi:hypothetical protein KAS14_01255 [Candidatus Bathyarchaeota archaeon]|nr:hypothetical protein [Candidatus Bathyarchaeota archaeon]
MAPSILRRYKRSNNLSTNKQWRIDCEDCLYFNPFGKFCELRVDILGDSCDKFEDRKKDLIKQTRKIVGEVPK